MKRYRLPVIAWTLILTGSLILAIGGWIKVVRVCDRCEDILLEHSSHAALLNILRPQGAALLIASGMLVAAVGLSLILTAWISRKGHREIQELKEKNEEMARLNAQLQEMAHHQRLELLGTLTTSISHEFNNLLTPIMGYSLMALERVPEADTELYDGLVEIYEASKKAKTIISRLSDLSRKNSSSFFRQLSLDELVRKTLDVAGPAKPEGVEIKLNLNCWDQRMTANELQLSQLLLNLILNGFHAMSAEGGFLTVDTWFDEDSFFLMVSDTGCGIPEENLSHIFDPFFTTKEAGSGTGLGLAIVAQVVEEHHGSIHVDSMAGKGASFTVTLPRHIESKQNNSTKT